MKTFSEHFSIIIVVVLVVYIFLNIIECTQAFFSENILREKYSDESSSSLHVVNYNNYYDFEGSESFLPHDYNSFCPPGEKDGKQVNISFSIILMNVEVNEINEELKLEMNFRVMWLDQRLENLTGQNEFFVLNPKLPIWIPDVFFDHLKSIPDPYLLSKPKSIRLYRNGSIRFSARTNIVISCHMNFHLYPAHILHCPIDVMSYAYPSNILALGWENNSTASASLNDELNIPNYKLQLIPTTFRKSSSSGVYSGIRMTIKLRNQFFFGFHMLQTYFPSALLLILSWFTFLIPQSFGALLRCFQVMLAAVMLFSTIRQTTPRVSYVKALDIWVVFCICFIFFITLHHAITLKLRNIKALKPIKREELCKGGKKLVEKQDSIWDVDSNVLPIAYKSHEQALSESTTTLETNLSSVAGSSRSCNSINNDHHEIQIAQKITSNQEDLNKKAAEQYRNIGNLIRSRLRAITPIILIVFSIIYWVWLFIASECF